MAVMPGSVVAPPLSGAATQKDGVDSQDIVLKVLGVIGTGIGILGFVTLFGGAIIWVRASEAGLPPIDAVAVVPRAVLIATGASFLVPALLLAVLAVLAIATVHLFVALRVRVKAQDKSSQATLLRQQADKATLLVEPEEQRAVAARTLAEAQRDVHRLAVEGGGSASSVDQLNAQATDQEREAEQAEALAAKVRATAASRDAEALRAEAERELALQIKPGLDSPQRIVEYVFTFIVLTVIPLAVDGPFKEVGTQRTIVLFIVAIAAAVVSVVTYLVTERFLWLGVVAFLSVGIYTGFVTYFRTVKHLKLEPVAALRSERPPLMGFFVAESSENVYLGAFAGQTGGSRLLVIPRAQVTDMAIGPLLEPAVARKRALELVQRICAQSLERGQGRTRVSVPVCNEQDLVALSGS